MMSPLMMPPPPPPGSAAASVAIGPRTPIEQQHSADVIAAATLLQNGPLARGHGSPLDQMFGRGMASPLGPPIGHLRHQPMADFRKESQTPVAGNHDNTFAEMMFGPPGRAAAPRNNPIADDVRWGTDSSFNPGHGFLAHNPKETVEALEKRRLAYMECLAVAESAATTQPSSPAPNGDAPTAARPRAASVLSYSRAGDDLEGPPRKRRKSRANEDVDDDDNEAPLSSSSTKPSRRRKPTVSTSPPVEASIRRRKSANGSSKQPRENLTDDQKRENHIKSEQKRRTLIKVGFDDLSDLVPDLRGGGFSKSTVLSMAADWLEQLVQGNMELREQLAGR